MRIEIMSTLNVKYAGNISVIPHSLTLMLVTFDVLQADMSPLKELAPKNIYCTLFKTRKYKTQWLEIFDLFSHMSQHKLLYIIRNEKKTMVRNLRFIFSYVSAQIEI